MSSAATAFYTTLASQAPTMMTKSSVRRSHSHAAGASSAVSDAIPRCTCPEPHASMSTTGRVNYIQEPNWPLKVPQNGALEMDEREMYEREIEDLKRQLSEKDHQMTLYQTQLGVWMEDFKQERRDREKAQSKVIDLEKELLLHKELLNDHTRQHAAAAQRRRQEAITRIRKEYYGPAHSEVQHQRYRQEPVFRNRGGGIVVCDGEEERPLAEDEDIIDTLVEPEVTQAAQPDSSSKRDLECPKCSHGFDIAQHVEFLDHIDQCSH